jgi:hypothetical protein
MTEWLSVDLIDAEIIIEDKKKPTAMSGLLSSVY